MKRRLFRRLLLALLTTALLSILPFGCGQKQAEDTSNSAPASPPGGKVPVTDGPTSSAGNKLQAAPAPPP
jgi:hypothetical protein